MITIRIDGPRGSGKTTTAIAIVMLLRSMGQACTYVGHSERQCREIENLMHDEDYPAITEQKQFRVVDRSENDA